MDNMKKQFHGDGIEIRGTWCYKLEDPYRQLPYYPIDAHGLAEHLEISYRTALRICHGERKLSRAHVVYLQVVIFGYIPDKDLHRGRWYFRDGCLRTHRAPNYELSGGEMLEMFLLRLEHLRTAAALDEARALIRELTAPPPPPANVLAFPARRRPGNGPEGAA